MAEKENTTAKQPKKETAEANDPKKVVKTEKAKKEGLKKVRITGAVAWLGLPYNFGQEVEIEAVQAKELIDLKRAEEI